MQRTRWSTAVLVLIVPVAAVLAIVFTAAFASDSGSDASAAKVVANQIVIKNFAFEPATTNATAGITLTVKNLDTSTHTLTAKDKKSFDTGDLDGGKTATITVPKPGRYAYYCQIHNYMTGVLVVGG